MKRLLAISIFSAAFLAPCAWTAPEAINRHLPDAQLVGTARLKVLFWDIYDAQLFAPDGRYKSEQPFALRLEYLRALDGEKIAQRSVKEMRKLGFDDEQKLEQWFSLMTDIFPDVESGTQLTGIRTDDGATLFLKNRSLLAKVEDPTFTQWFFRIWLGENTSEPEMRRALLGMSQ